MLPFHLVILTFQHLLMELRALLPFLTGNSKNTIVDIQIGSIKRHLRVFALLHNVHGQISLLQLVGPFFGEGQKVAVQVAAFLQIILGQHRVRHGVFIQCLLW